MPARDPFGWVGHTVANKLRVETVVAEGGFAVVYRARHLGFDVPVALKCLKLPAQLEGVERDRFLRAFLEEGRLLHRLSRSNAGIVQALDVGAAVSPSGAWTPYLALEWLDGVTLDEDMVERERRGTPPRTVAEVIELLDTAADALAFAHEQGIAHRDIKPPNLFIVELGGHRIVKVVDFGIAKVMSDVVTTSGAMAATGAALPAFSPRYGAPEQFDRSFGATGPWTDVFGFALVIVELLTGRPALDGDDTLQLFVASSNPARRPTPRALGASVTNGVEGVLARALAVEPAERFATVGAMWTALKTAAEHEPIDARVAAPVVVVVPAVSPATARRTAPAARARRPARVAAIALVACMPLGALAFVVAGTGHDAARNVSSTTTLTSSEPERRATSPSPVPSRSPAPAPLPTPSPLPPTPSPPPSPATPAAPAATAATLASASELAPAAESIRASHILVSYAGASAAASTRTREEARARADEVAARLARGEDFAQLAAEYGDDATRARGGDLGTFSRHKFPAAFTAAAFALAPGETSAVVETRFGFHVIRRTE